MESLKERYADVQCCLGTTRRSFSCEVPVILVGNQYSFETHLYSISPFTCTRCGLLQTLANPQDLRVLVLGGF